MPFQPFRPDFFQRIINVNFGGLWCGIFAKALTGNNSVPVDAAGSAEVGGHAVSLFTGTEFINGQSVILTPPVLAEATPSLDYWQNFEFELTDPFLSTVSHLSLFDLGRLPSTFGPGVPIPGSVTLEMGGITTGELYAYVVKSTQLANDRVALAALDGSTGLWIPVQTPPTPMHGSPLINSDFDPTITINFEINLANETITQT